MPKKKPRKPKKNSSKRQKKKFVLQKATPEDIVSKREEAERNIEYQWRYYSEVAYQRQHNSELITKVLNEIAIQNYTFKSWQRAVRYKFSLHPLCTLGSLKMQGGRFNIGDINPNVPQFSCLYVAKNKDTALQETLLSITGEEDDSPLTQMELALMKPDSITLVSLDGMLDKVLDVRDPKLLKPFLEIIKTFKLSEDLKKHAKRVGREDPSLVTTVEELRACLIDSDWRLFPINFDVPSNSQIIGQLVANAGIQGILYSSIKSNEDCLAIFPNNFHGSHSYVEISGGSDELPSDRVPYRLDKHTYPHAEIQLKDLM